MPNFLQHTTDSDVKQKITLHIRDWQRTFPEINSATIKVIKGWKDELRDGKLNETKGLDYLEQRLMEWPEDLYFYLVAKLAAEDMQWLGSKNGMRWAAKTFREYTLPDKV